MPASVESDPSVVRMIHDLCERHAARTALVPMRWNATASRYERGAATSYAELHDRTLRFADALAARGIGAGSRVAVLLDNSVELVVTEWACLVSGRIWVALNVRSSAAEQAAILRDALPAIVVVAPRYRGRIDEAALPRGCDVVETGGEWEAMLAAASPRLPAHEPASEEPVRLRYTSGTAGLPKGAVLPRRCYDASVPVVSELIGPLSASDVVAQAAPMTHAAGAMWLPHAVAGGSALLADHFDAASFVDLAARESVSSVFLVPTMLVRFVEALQASARTRTQRGALLPALRSVVYGGASMPVDRLERALDLLGPVLVQIYGLTESNWPVAALRREEHLFDGDGPARRRRLASCGRATSVGQIRIVRDDGSEAPDGEAGELLVRGRNTMLGYWAGSAAGRDARGFAGTGGETKGLDAAGIGGETKGLDAAGIGGETKGLDAAGWMHTGDVAVRDADGFVTIVDRLHDMIVSGGFNVYPREVEDALSSHPSVLESAVVGRADAEWGERVHAVVVLRDGASPCEQELARHVAERTAPYKKPRSFEFVAELPKNAAGKVLRRALKTTAPPSS
jgi:acyl-CoA synthetase (AMP-forming)/AMP-acid ligase II